MNGKAGERCAAKACAEAFTISIEKRILSNYNLNCGLMQVFPQLSDKLFCQLLEQRSVASRALRGA